MYDYEGYQKALDSYNKTPVQYNQKTGQPIANSQKAPTLEQFKLDNGGVPQYTQTVQLSPEQQKLLDLQTQAQTKMGSTANDQLSRLQQSLSAPVDYSGAPALQNGMDEATRNAAEQALMARINPQLDRERQSLESKLASQGITMGSEAYNKGMDQYGRQANDARSQAILQAIQQGQSAASQNNAARQQYIQEAASVRNQPLNEISALMSGSQVTAPQFSPVPQVGVANADITGPTALQYQGQLANWNAQQQANNATMGGLFGLGGSVASALPWATWLSDRRLKRDIKKLGKWKGFNLYRFKYLWDDLIHIGVMAQEVEKTRPDAVIDVYGYKAVKYGVL